MFVSEKKWLDGPEREIERKRIMLDHKKIYIYGFDLFMILILKHLLKQNKQMQKQLKKKATLIESFYYFRKTINPFSYTKFPVKKINVAQILKL
jgi:hypothetical protein